MRPADLDNLVAIYNADDTLTGLLGDDHVYKYRGPNPPTIPCVMVADENDTSSLMPGYSHLKNRDCNSYVRLDIYMRGDIDTGNTIEARIDAITPGSLTESWGWAKSTRSKTYDDKLKAWHTVIRWGYAYTLID